MVDTYVRSAELIRVIDGDTYRLRIQLGFFVSMEITVRVQGIDTPEMNTSAGKVARLRALALLESGKITMRAMGTQTFARWVADVWIDNISIAQTLISNGYGVPKMVQFATPSMISNLNADEIID